MHGYHGTLTAWRSQNSADAGKIAHAYARNPRLETVVGERDANFNHVSTGI